MVVANLKKIKKTANIHKRRISDTSVFWGVVLFVIALSHYYLYQAVGIYLNGWLEALWLFVGAVAILSSTAVRKLGLPKRRIGNVSFQSAIHRFGASWNIFVLLVSLFMFALQTFAALSAESAFGLSCLLSLGVCAYGIYEARTIRTVHLEMLTTKRFSAAGRLRVVQMSDLHIGPFMNIGHVSRVVDKILAARPDIVVITGDLVDGAIGDKDGVSSFYKPYANELARLRAAAPKLGVWAVPGNHDSYGDFVNTKKFIEMSQISLLATEMCDLGDIFLIGADDRDHLEPADDESGYTRSEKLMASVPLEQREKFCLLLRHRPVVEKPTLGIFDLQLSGHTHGGQLFSLPSSRHKIPGRCRGLMYLKGDSYIYVSNGAGFVGPPMRFLAPAEIVTIDIVALDERLNPANRANDGKI